MFGVGTLDSDCMLDGQCCTMLDRGMLIFCACLVALGSYLVDLASSHMLVSKIKPCMSKYK